ncbi:DUF6046 domain-containing protein [Chitinophaga sancti]|uniref:DUF6046 domain-containing protein n=1 Tax=Chitinophaga sancti TaxID=1004 RepID=UPI002A7558D9|nr:DUF6046 domain-containing protein [Chitinophaga sancti]WPQ62217.1 DUF6046 domain-containing protein [Chitinophaga sancti]
MALNIDISSTFTSTFGYTPETLNVLTQPDTNKRGTSYFGKETWNKAYFMAVKIGPLELYNPVISISNQKTIVQTALVNRSGTVKEMISKEDYKINIKGIILRDDNTFPDGEISDLMDLYNRNEALSIECALTSLIFGEGEKVVITDLSFPPSPGTKNIQAYEMNLISDLKFILNKA